MSVSHDMERMIPEPGEQAQTESQAALESGEFICPTCGTLVPIKHLPLGTRIQALRMAKGWDYADLSAQAWMPMDRLKRIERGQDPTLYEAFKIARLFGISLDALVEEAF